MCVPRGTLLLLAATTLLACAGSAPAPRTSTPSVKAQEPQEAADEQCKRELQHAFSRVASAIGEPAGYHGARLSPRVMLYGYFTLVEAASSPLFLVRIEVASGTESAWSHRPGLPDGFLVVGQDREPYTIPSDAPDGHLAKQGRHASALIWRRVSSPEIDALFEAAADKCLESWASAPAGVPHD